MTLTDEELGLLTARLDECIDILYRNHREDEQIGRVTTILTFINHALRYKDNLEWLREKTGQYGHPGL